MNIIFIYTSAIIPDKGGVQRVTEVLRNYFIKSNYNVIYLSTKDINNDNRRRSNQYFLPNSEVLMSNENLEFFDVLLRKHDINILINQAALGGTLVQFCSYAKRKANLCVISVVHNSLLGNVINYKHSHANEIKKIPIPFFSTIFDLSIVKKILLYFYIMKYRKAYELTCFESDKVVLLSKGYFEELKLLAPNCDFEKVTSIANPCTIAPGNEIVQKQNQLLYVGRINTTQKKVDTLLDIWGRIFETFPDWTLTIVGDGDERYKLEKRAIKMGLKRIYFVGNVDDPSQYYKSSKILCMTSSYEGFALVLKEAQVFGTIPIAFDSFASIKDIIDDEMTGVLIKPFDTDEYISKLSKLMSDDKRMKILASNCKASITRFTTEAVGQQWVELFGNLYRFNENTNY